MNAQEQLDYLRRGAVEIISEEEAHNKFEKSDSGQDFRSP